MLLAELESQIMGRGFTPLSNPLEDFLLRELPADPYYKVWRHVWRLTVGWHELRKVTSTRSIREATGVNKTAASRALHFFQLTSLVNYEPGDNGASHVTILPNGLPDQKGLDRLYDFTLALKSVEASENKLRRANKDFTFTNAEFCNHIRTMAAVFSAGITDARFYAAEALVQTPRSTPRPKRKGRETVLVAGTDAAFHGNHPYQ